MPDFSDLFDFGPQVDPVQPADDAGGGGEVVAAPPPPVAPKGELAQAILRTADRLGIDPEDLATAISYETGGRFSTSMMGGAGGNYMGLIQFGPEERRTYGARPDQTPSEQMDAVERYLRDRGLKPGMGMLDLYSTINAGRPGLYNRSDANNGGAPGTVRDKVEQQMAAHRAKARAMLTGVAAEVAQASSVQRDQTVGPTRIVVRPEGVVPPNAEGSVDSDGSLAPAQAQPIAPPPVVPPTTPIAGNFVQALQGLLDSDQAAAENSKKDPASVANPDQGIANTLVASAPVAQPDIPPGIAPPISALNPQTQVAAAAAPVPAPAPQQPSVLVGAATEVGKQAQQLASGALGAATGLPVDLAAALTALVALPARAIGYEGPAQTFAAVHNTAEKMRQGADFATGAGKPETPGQSLARVIGRNVGPTIGTTALGTGIDLAASTMLPNPAAANPIDKQTAERLLLPAPIPNQLRVTHTMKTAGGWATLGENEWKTLGIMGAATLGAIFAPSLVRKVNALRLPVYRDVPNTPGAVTISNRVDLARNYDDVNAGIKRVARRAGMDPKVLEHISDTLQIQTGGAARNLVNSAVTTGRMETPAFTFQSKVPVAELAKADSPDVRNYLHARNTYDDIIKAEADLAKKSKNAQAQAAAAGPVTVRGMTRQDALDTVNAYERAIPELRQLADGYFNNVAEMRKFLYRGEYGTLSNKEMKELGQLSKNYVPWKDGESYRTLTDASIDRGNPFKNLAESMQKQMRFRMENEGKMTYIDEMNKINPDFFVQVTAKEVKDNAGNWAKEGKLIKGYRRGKPEYYVADPFLAGSLERDPFGTMAMLPMTLQLTKRLAESGATGKLAPWFSVTSGLRSWQIGKITADEGRKAPTLLGTMKAVPQQLYPQAAKAIANSLDNGSAGWLVSTLGQPTVDALARKISKSMLDMHDRSLFAKLETAGSYHGSFLDHQKAFNGKIAEMARTASGPMKNFWDAYSAFLGSVHNAPSFNYASRNVGSVPLPKLAMEARHLTGDPMAGGQFYSKGRAPFTVEKPFFGSDLAGKAATKAVQGYGALTEIGREAIPWWNITTQGAKRIGEAYTNNPAKFVSRVYGYQVTPAAAMFMYNRSLGLDPNGMSYTDYQNNGRSDYNRLMNWYIAQPGKPAQDGLEIPRFHELAPIAHMTEIALDHLSRSQTFQQGEDFLRAGIALLGGKDFFPKDNGGALFSEWEDAKNLGAATYEAAIVPPTPPIVNALFGAAGFASTGSTMFTGGNVYRKKIDPYDQLGGMNATVELVTRAVGTGLADVLGAGYAAYAQTPEGFTNGLVNGLKETGSRMVSKTPILRNVAGILPPQTGSTDLTEKLFAKEKVINNLSRYFRTWDDSRGAGKIGLKPASKAGAEVVTDLLGPDPSAEYAGLVQPPPTNPLYQQFMKEVYDKTNADDPKKGGMGFKSIWRRYGDYTQHLKSLRSINAGNMVTWQMQLATRPDQLADLKNAGVDHRDVRAVRNYYETKRQEVVRQLLFSIRAVEEDISKRIGKPFKMEDLDPYAKGPRAGVELAPTPTIPPWADGTGAGL